MIAVSYQTSAARGDFDQYEAAEMQLVDKNGQIFKFKMIAVSFLFDTGASSRSNPRKNAGISFEEGMIAQSLQIWVLRRRLTMITPVSAPPGFARLHIGRRS
jgi:hypothetical protein